MKENNIRYTKKIPSPNELKTEFPLGDIKLKNFIKKSQRIIKDILSGKRSEMIAIVGPCSIHNHNEALHYADRLSNLIEKTPNLFIVMRACMDKPRSGHGWPGFFSDPDLNGSYNIGKGWRIGRKTLVDITKLKIPIGMELMDIDAFQNLDDIISYWWIGARTVTSQRLRQIASATSNAIGFKNGADKDGLISAVSAIDVAQHPTVFAGPDENGTRKAFYTKGNKFGHLILRGTSSGPNYSIRDVNGAIKNLEKNNLLRKLIVDASHANSGKDHLKQRDIIMELAKRKSKGDNRVIGFLYESYIEDGSQSLKKDLNKIKPYISITDGCDGWERTEQTLLQANKILEK